jgi:hypothetical protein
MHTKCDGKIFWGVATWKTKRGEDGRWMELAQFRQALDLVNLPVLLLES